MARRYVGPADVGAAPAIHNHPVGDITATGTADGTTYLRGDGAWVAPASPAATETAAGIVELATQAEIEAGTAGLLVATATRLKAEFDRRHTAESWIAPTLQNGWVDFGAPHATAGYYKNPFGEVLLKGLIKSGTVATDTTGTAFTLPAGYRPLADHIYAALAGGDAIARIDVKADGNVRVMSSPNVVGAQTYTSLAGIRFRAEQ